MDRLVWYLGLQLDGYHPGDRCLMCIGGYRGLLLNEYQRYWGLMLGQYHGLLLGRYRRLLFGGYREYQRYWGQLLSGTGAV